jgi:hypothetical protein
MRKLLLVALLLLVSGSIAMAQNKIDTKWHCPKPTADNKFDVGDVPEHIYWIGQGACSATSSGDAFKEKSAEYTEFQERWKASYNNHGRFNVTLDNGDRVYSTPARKYSCHERAHLLQHLRPHRDADFSEMRFAEQQHQRARLPDSSADRQRNLVVQDRLVIGQLHEVQLLRHRSCFFRVSAVTRMPIDVSS